MTLLSVLLSVCFLLLSIEGFVNCSNYLVSPLNCHICVVAGNSYFPFFYRVLPLGMKRKMLG